MKIDDFKKDIEEYLENYYNGRDGYNKLIYEAASYSLNLGGKRIRPILCLLAYSLYQKDYKRVMPVAAAIEMIHTYSLIHDDLPCMDNDDLRRGKPTNHKVFGENFAVLAGDTLLNEAMIHMMDFAIREGKNSLLAIKEIALAAGPEGMIGGQVVDILSENRKIDENELKYMHEKKTGELIRVSIISGAILGDAPGEDIELLDSFGRKLGLAFQIKDDILDVVGSVQKLGKNPKMDESRNKTNFITMYGLEVCQELCKRLTEESIGLLNKLTVDSHYLKELTYSLLDREY